MTYVFLGTLSFPRNGGFKLNEYGQRIELTPELAEDCKKPGGLICIPAEDFDAIFDGPDDRALLAKYRNVASHDNAPKDFLDKKKRAAGRLHEIRYGGAE